MVNEDIYNDFIKNTKDHMMRVEHDHDVHRNIHFGKKGCSEYWFGITTWPGYLCIYGDMGDTVFSRTHDMFKFFRNSEMLINPSYWHEKVKSISRFGGDKEFSIDLYKNAVKYNYDTIVEDNELDQDEQKELWQEVEDQLLTYLDECNEVDCVRKGMEFKSSKGYEFYDFWDHNFKEYTFHFIWQLYAIVWGIDQYDQVKEKMDREVA